MATSEENYTSPVMKNITKYRFPAIEIKYGLFFTLDTTQQVMEPYYYKYDDGSGKNLSAEEKIYNLWVDLATKKFMGQ